MKHYFLFLVLIIGVQINLFSQVQAPSISDPISLQYACRNVNISQVSLNKTGNNVLTNVAPNSKINVSFKFNVSQGCDYCPSCIVQLYWGIHNYYSDCMISFYGFDQNSRILGNHKVTGEFFAPEKPGIYYITIGGTLDYSCKNSLDKPECPKERAFAAIAVGNPVSTAHISVSEMDSNSDIPVLNAVTKGEGLTGPFNSFEWYFNDSLMKDQKTAQIKVNKIGTYKVTWYNCIREEVSATYDLNSLNQKVSVSSLDSTSKTNMLTIKGRVLDDSTKKVLSGIVYFDVDGKSSNTMSAEINDGTVLFHPKEKSDFRIHAKVAGYFGNDVLIKKEAFDGGNSVETEIRMIPLKKGNSIVLNNLLFHRADFHLTDESKKQIDHLADIMNQNKEMRIGLYGHTDNVGDPKKDMLLSSQRAEQVKFYLISKGIAASRIETKGFGGTRPIASNDHEETRKLNRRVEMVIL